MSDIRIAEYEFGEKVWYKISDDCVDTSEHDKQIRVDAIDECIDALDYCVTVSECQGILREIKEKIDV